MRINRFVFPVVLFFIPSLAYSSDVFWCRSEGYFQNNNNLRTISDIPLMDKADINRLAPSQLTLLGMASEHLAITAQNISAGNSIVNIMPFLLKELNKEYDIDIDELEMDDGKTVTQTEFSELISQAANSDPQGFNEEFEKTIRVIRKLINDGADPDLPMISGLCITSRDLLEIASIIYPENIAIKEIVDSLGQNKSLPIKPISEVFPDLNTKLKLEILMAGEKVRRGPAWLSVESLVHTYMGKLRSCKLDKHSAISICPKQIIPLPKVRKIRKVKTTSFDEPKNRVKSLEKIEGWGMIKPDRKAHCVLPVTDNPFNPYGLQVVNLFIDIDSCDITCKKRIVYAFIQAVVDWKYTLNLDVHHLFGIRTQFGVFLDNRYIKYINEFTQAAKSRSISSLAGLNSVELESVSSQLIKQLQEQDGLFSAVSGDINISPFKGYLLAPSDNPFFWEASYVPTNELLLGIVTCAIASAYQEYPVSGRNDICPHLPNNKILRINVNRKNFPSVETIADRDGRQISLSLKKCFIDSNSKQIFETESSCKNQILSLTDVARHEVGHWLGISHIENSTGNLNFMSPGYNPNMKSCFTYADQMAAVKVTSNASSSATEIIESLRLVE